MKPLCVVLYHTCMCRCYMLPPRRHPLNLPTRLPLSLPLRDPPSLPTRLPLSLPLRDPPSLPLRDPPSLPPRDPPSLPLRDPPSLPLGLPVDCNVPSVYWAMSRTITVNYINLVTFFCTYSRLISTFSNLDERMVIWKKCKHKLKHVARHSNVVPPTLQK